MLRYDGLHFASLQRTTRERSHNASLRASPGEEISPVQVGLSDRVGGEMLLPKRGTDILQGGFNQRDELTARADAEQRRLSDRRRTTLGRLAGRQTRVVPMDTGDLRPCPFCRYDKPRLALFGNEEAQIRSEEHTSELQSRLHLVCRLLLEKKKKRLHSQAARI